MEQILFYVIEFFFYSAAGWLVECIYRSIGEKRIINSGFLTGPLCPIYGTAALFLTVLLYNNFRDRPLLIFLLGMLLCDVVEFLTSWIMEKLFHARWWDYTYEFLNIQGRVCIKHTLYWGIISIAFVMVLHPSVDSLLHRLPEKYFGVVVAAIMVVFLLDVGNAVRKAADFRALQDKLHALTESLSGTLTSVKTAVGTRSERMSDSINNRMEQAQDFLTQFELRFSTRGDKKDRFTRRIFRNNFSVAQATRKRVEKLKAIRDEIRVVLHEQDELQ